VRLLAIAAAAALLPAPVYARRSAPAPPPPAGTYVIHAIDVGTGLSIFVEGHDFTLLYDAGSKEENGGPNNRVVAYLKSVRPGLRRIDHLILSHPHEDHSELMPDVLTNYWVRDVWDSGSLNNICSYRDFLKKVVAETGTTYHDALGGPGTHLAAFPPKGGCAGRALPRETISVPRGSQIAIGAPVQLGSDARMTVLHADGNRTSDFNEASVVVRLDLGSRRILLPGDAEGGDREHSNDPPTRHTVEADLLRDPASLAADILVVGHHGSKTSSRREFLDAVGARYFVISSGPYPYGPHRDVVLPDPEIEARLRERPGTISIWRTFETDEACVRRPAKVGLDDNKPGGCDNVRIVIGPSGTITSDYNRIAD
jgi:competence protein ComEC